MKLTYGDVVVEVVPERGAMVSSLEVVGTPLLYMDAATLADPARNVRGGIPLLFPFAGKLADDLFTLTNTHIKQHGFARDRAWVVTEQRAGLIRMALAGDAETRAQFPYEVAAEHSVMITPRGVQLELAVAAGAAPVPVAPGWHPYFQVAPQDKAAVRGDVVGFTPDQLGDDREFDFGLVAPNSGRARFAIPGPSSGAAKVIELAFSPEMRHLQFWSQPGKPFICLEPFFGPAGAINTERRAWVPAHETRTFWMRIELI